MGRASHTREKIVEAACELFHRHGYQSVGVQEICDVASVKKGSFYHFFRSKQELALAMLDAMWERAQEQEFRPFLDKGLPPLERIGHYLERVAETSAAMRASAGAVCGCPFGNMALEMSTQDNEIRRKLDQIFDAWARHLETALAEAVAQGDLPPMDTAAAADSVVAFMSGAALLAKTRNSLDGTTRLRETVLRLVQPAAGAPPAGRA